MDKLIQIVIEKAVEISTNIMQRGEGSSLGVLSKYRIIMMVGNDKEQ